MRRKIDKERGSEGERKRGREGMRERGGRRHLILFVRNKDGQIKLENRIPIFVGKKIQSEIDFNEAILI